MCVTDWIKLSLLREVLLKKAKMKAKKKPRRRSDSSGGYTLSDIIQSPPAAGRLHKHTTADEHVPLSLPSHIMTANILFHIHHMSFKSTLLI